MTYIRFQSAIKFVILYTLALFIAPKAAIARQQICEAHFISYPLVLEDPSPQTDPRGIRGLRSLSDTQRRRARPIETVERFNISNGVGESSSHFVFINHRGLKGWRARIRSIMGGKDQTIKGYYFGGGLVQFGPVPIVRFPENHRFAQDDWNTYLTLFCRDISF